MDATEERIAAINFANSMRGKYIISQALNYAIKHLRKLEKREDAHPPNGEYADISARNDMEYLERNVFPLYATYKEESDEPSTVQKQTNK